MNIRVTSPPSGCRDGALCAGIRPAYAGTPAAPAPSHCRSVPADFFFSTASHQPSGPGKGMK